MGAARDSEDPAMTDRFDDADPTQAASATAHLLDELQLHCYRPFADEPDPRPLPAPDRLSGAIADIFDALVASLGETRLEPDLPDLLWSLVNLFHRGIDRIGRELDNNEADQQRSQREQDGSEVRSVELERLLAQGLTLIERRNACEFLRDSAAEHFEQNTGSAWRPRAGSMVSLGTMLVLLFTLAIYAVPFFVGLTVGMPAFETGTGVIGVLQELIDLDPGEGFVGHFFVASVPGPPDLSGAFWQTVSRSYSSTAMTMTTPRPCF